MAYRADYPISQDQGVQIIEKLQLLINRMSGKSISSIALVETVGNTKRYRITYTDNTYYDFYVEDGVVTEEEYEEILTALSNKVNIPEQEGGVGQVLAYLGGGKTYWKNAGQGADAYPDLTYKPKINDVELVGDHNAEYYGLADKETTATSSTIAYNATTHVLTITLKNIDGDVIDTQTITLPFGNLIVSGNYDEENHRIVLTKDDGSKINISLANIANWLASKDYVDDEIQELKEYTDDEILKVVHVIALEYSNTKTYEIGQYSTRNNKLYRNIVRAAAEEWNPTHWVETDVASEILNAGKVRKVNGIDPDSGGNIQIDGRQIQTDGANPDSPTLKTFYDNTVLALTTQSSQIANEVTRATAAETHLDKIKADRAVLAFLDRRAEYIYKHIGQNQEYNIEAHPTTSEPTEAYSRDLASGVQGVIPKTYGGKTRAVNQLVAGADFSNADAWTYQRSTLTVSGNIAKITCTTAGIIALYSTVAASNPIYANHKYYVKSRIKTSESGAIIRACLNKDSISSNYKTLKTSSDVTSDWGVYEAIVPASEDSTGIRLSTTSSAAVGDSVEFNYVYNVDLTQWFGAGNEPEDVNDTRMDEVKKFIAQNPAYNPGELRSADVSQVATVGRNRYNQAEFLNADEWSYNGEYYTGLSSKLTTYLLAHPITGFKPNTRYVISCVGYNANTSSNFRFVFNYTDGSKGQFYIGNRGTTPTYNSLASDAGKTISSITADYSSSAQIYIKSFQIEEGSSSTNYIPYMSSLLRIPTQLRTFLKQHGYGLSAGSLYNNVDFLNKVSTELLKKENLGADGISFTESRDGGYYTSSLNKKEGSRNVIIGSYTLQSGNWGWENFNSYPNMVFGVNSGSSLFFKNTAYTSSSDFKASLANEYVVFEIATPNHYYDPTSPLLAANGGSIVPDLIMTSAETEITSDKHHIQLWESMFPDTNADLALLAESGGTVTFEQATPDDEVALELPVPNTLDYLVNVPQAAENL